MTVCVAAIAENSMLIGASDRMITSGDVQFEPDDPKIYPLTNSMVVMMSGEMTLHAEVFEQVRAEIYERIEFDPTEWVRIKDVAELYCHYYCELQKKEAERKFLRPLGLDLDAFTSRQREMLPEEVQRIGNYITNYDPGEFEAIVTGIDETGPHIWVVKKEETHCCNRVGFAAIGYGAARAESEFMFAGHTRYKPFSDTLHLTYIAKKRAEVAPGVGSDTDMFFAGPQVGTVSFVGEHVLDMLKATYTKLKRKESRILLDSRKWVDANVKKFAEEAAAKAQVALPEEGGAITGTDQRQLRDGVAEKEPEDGEDEPTP